MANTSVVKTYVAHMLKHSICCTFTASCVVVVVVVVRPWHPFVVVVVVVVRPWYPYVVVVVVGNKGMLTRLPYTPCTFQESIIVTKAPS